MDYHVSLVIKHFLRKCPVCYLPTAERIWSSDKTVLVLRHVFVTTSFSLNGNKEMTLLIQNTNPRYKVMSLNDCLE